MVKFVANLVGEKPVETDDNVVFNKLILDGKKMLSYEVHLPAEGSISRVDIYVDPVMGIIVVNGDIALNENIKRERIPHIVVRYRLAVNMADTTKRQMEKVIHFIGWKYPNKEREPVYAKKGSGEGMIIIRSGPL